MRSEGGLSLLASDLSAIARSDSHDFLQLTEIAGLNPATDFVGADLRGADLRGLDLRSFNLSGADLGGALIEGAQFDESRSRGEINSREARGRWLEIESSSGVPLDGPPAAAIQLMARIRDTEGFFESLQMIRQLLVAHSSYRPLAAPLGWLRSLFQGSRVRKVAQIPTAGSAPKWLEEFLIELLGRRRNDQIVELLTDAYRVLVGTAPAAYRVVMKRAEFAQYVDWQIEAIKELADKYRNETTAQSLLRALAVQDVDSRVRVAALDAIELVDDNWAELKDIMLERYQSAEEEAERGAALRQLARFRHVDQAILSIIVDAALDADEHHSRAAAIMALGDFLDESPVVGQIISKSLYGKPGPGQLAAIAVIEKAFAGSRQSLKQILDDVYERSSNGVSRYYVLCAMQRSLPHDERFYEVLMHELTGLSEVERDLRKQDAGLEVAREKCVELVALDYFDRPEVRELLKHLCRSDENSMVRRKALIGLSRSYPDEDQMRELVWERCRVETDAYSRAIALEMVASSEAVHDPAALAFLKQLYAERPEGFEWAQRAWKLVGMPGF